MPPNFSSKSAWVQGSRVLWIGLKYSQLERTLKTASHIIAVKLFNAVEHSMQGQIPTLRSMPTVHMASILWEYCLLSSYFKVKRLPVQTSELQLFCCTLFQNSHNHSESWERIGYTWRSNLFQGSYEEVKLVLCMNKQPSQTYSSLDALTEKPFSFSIFNTAFSWA